MNLTTFTDLGISTSILQAVESMGFETPSKIQTAAIPKILSGRDIAGKAQTGTGKTAAFAIPILERIDPQTRQIQALVMCPTRELAIQVTGEFVKLSRFMDNVVVTPVYGGQPIERQIKQIKNGTQIVVGTPGRVIDHLKRGTLKLDHLDMIVLDEADEMLNMGFREDIELILDFTGAERPRQTIMFSATMSPAIKKIMSRFFNEPEMISIQDDVTTADGVEQYIIECRDSVRVEGICRLMDFHNFRLGLIFCNTRRECDSLVGEMQARGYSADALHGEMSQYIRDKVMEKFRNKKLDVLIATDVAARGLDVEQVDVVFNYDIPQDPEYYVHRIGRTGRAGRNGMAFTFCSGRKYKNIRYIERTLKTRIQVMAMPSVKDVRDSARSAFFGDLTKTLEAGGLKHYIEQIEELASTKYTPIEVAAALLKNIPGPHHPQNAQHDDLPETAFGDVSDFQDVKPKKGSRGSGRGSKPSHKKSKSRSRFEKAKPGKNKYSANKAGKRKKKNS